jgi:lactoylglutathione lyase
MHVERVKYVIWAADLTRATRFYQTVFGAEVTKSNSVMAEVEVAGAIIGIHGGGEGKRTWTGISFQVADVVAGAAEVISNGGGLVRDPADEDGEVPHLAMCYDTDGNEFMLIRRR